MRVREDQLLRSKETIMRMFVSTAIVLAFGIGSAWADAAAGEAIYASKCKACHGADGKGTPAMAKAMGVKPINGMSESQTKAAVTKGKNKMKPVTGLTPKQIDDVADYVKSLK
jgi:mono/diheme cytochrome c family protein